MNSPSMPHTNENIATIARGVRRALPFVLGYLPIGFAYGVLAIKNGLSPANTVLMSLLVYAGSAQLIAVALFATGVPPLSVIITTFVVNLRHMLMSASMAPHLRQWSMFHKVWFGFQLTDESFALHAMRFSEQESDRSATLAANMTLQSSWVLGTVLGITSSTLIGDVKPIGLDYALPAMFAALLVAQLKTRLQFCVALFCAFLSVVLAVLGVDRSNIIIATVLGATCGLGVEAWIRQRSS